MTVVLAVWLVAGVFLDGWAHNTRPVMETFFTPWHAVFYGGFAAVAGWIGWLAWSRRETGRKGAVALPPGYRPSGAGVVVFSLSGLADMGWHEAFGIEQDLAALLSPTHLGLFVGAVLIVTAPLRSLWSDRTIGRAATLGGVLPAAASLALACALCAFMLMELNVFKEAFYSMEMRQLIATSLSREGLVSDYNVQAGVAAFIVTTALLFGPLLFWLARWDLPAGLIVTVIGMQSVAIGALSGFADPGVITLGLVGAGVVEALALVLRPSPSRLVALRVFCVVAPAGFWSVFLAGAALLEGGLGWEAEILGGAIAWSALVVLGLSHVMYRPLTPGVEQ